MHADVELQYDNPQCIAIYPKIRDVAAAEREKVKVPFPLLSLFPWLSKQISCNGL